MTVDLKFRGEDGSVELTLAGGDLIQAVAKQRSIALYEGAKIVLAAARPKARRRTGNLRKSGYAAARGGPSSYKGGKGRRRQAKLREGQAVAAFSYFTAHFIEGGTRRSRAYPFVGPAVTAAKSRITAAVSQKMAAEVGL